MQGYVEALTRVEEFNETQIENSSDDEATDLEALDLDLKTALEEVKSLSLPDPSGWMNKGGDK